MWSWSNLFQLSRERWWWHRFCKLLGILLWAPISFSYGIQKRFSGLSYSTHMHGHVHAHMRAHTYKHACLFPWLCPPTRMPLPRDFARLHACLFPWLCLPARMPLPLTLPACTHASSPDFARLHACLFPWLCPPAFIFRQVPGTERPPKRWYDVNWYIVYPGLDLFWVEAESGRSISSAEWNVCFPFFVLKTWEVV